MNAEVVPLLLDASALLAYLQDEAGGEVVEQALTGAVAINVVNYAEVLSRLGDAGEDPANADLRLRERGIIGGLVEVATMTEADAIAIAALRRATRARGLSLADHACLAMGLRLGRAVLTSDRQWAAIDIGVDVRLIR